MYSFTTLYSVPVCVCSCNSALVTMNNAHLQVISVARQIILVSSSQRVCGERETKGRESARAEGRETHWTQRTVERDVSLCVDFELKRPQVTACLCPHSLHSWRGLIFVCMYVSLDHSHKREREREGVREMIVLCGEVTSYRMKNDTRWKWKLTVQWACNSRPFHWPQGFSD